MAGGLMYVATICACETPAASANPRSNGRCLRCHAPIPPKPTRNLPLERSVLFEAKQFCEAHHKITPWRYEQRVLKRLEKGAREYGDTFFFDRAMGENLSEAAEEPLDVASYMLFDLQQRWTQLDEEERGERRQRIVAVIAGAMWLYAQIEDLRREDARR